MADIGTGDKQEEAARQWMVKAEERLKQWSLFNKKAKYEDAAEYFIKAANIYKMSKKSELAAQAYIRAAQTWMEVDSKHEAATNYVNASNCLKKTSASDAAKNLQCAVDIYTDEGRFSIAAKHEKDIAEIFETEGEIESAIKHYQQAADYYDGEGSTTTGHTCLLKVAHLNASIAKFEKAIEIFEQVAQAASSNHLIKYGAREYLFKAGLLHLALGDLVSAKRALERYPEISVQFTGSRESKFLAEIIAASEKYDVESFTNAVIEYDSITKFDPWHTSLLLKIKEHIKSVDSDLT